MNPVDIAAEIRSKKTACSEGWHWLFPKPSCWACARNGAFERAARIVLAHGASLDAVTCTEASLPRVDDLSAKPGPPDEVTGL